MAERALIKNEPDRETMFAKAEKAYQEVLKALKEAPDRGMEARALLNLGMLWECQKNWREAERYYLLAQPLLEGLDFLEISARLYLNLGMVYLEQKKAEDAKHYFFKAVDYAKKAGEYLIQGLALGNLSYLERDADSMEIALELLEKSGNTERHAFYENDYEKIVKMNLETALLANNAREAQHLLTKLAHLYQRREADKSVANVQDALQALSQFTDLKASKDLLMAFIETKEHQAELSNPSN
jgi:tetratricopeptide (TPR) repeat protein